MNTIYGEHGKIEISTNTPRKGAVRIITSGKNGVIVSTFVIDADGMPVVTHSFAGFNGFHVQISEKDKAQEPVKVSSGHYLVVTIHP